MVCITSPIFEKIKERDFLCVLKSFLYIEDDDIKDQAILCIGNILVEGDEFKDKAIKIGILDRVVKLSKDLNKSIDMIKNCLFLMSNCLKMKPQPNLEKIGPSLSVVSACLWHKDLDVVKSSLWTISYISEGDETLQEKIISLGCIQKILEFAVMRKLELQLPALRIIGNLAAGSNKMAEVLMSNDAIKILIDLLNSQSNEKVVSEIMWIFVNFSLSTIKVINYIIASDKLNISLIRYLTLDAEGTKRYNVTGIYYNLCKNGNIFTIEKLVEKGIIQNICVLLCNVKMIDQFTACICLGLLNKVVIAYIRNCEGGDKVYNIIATSGLIDYFELQILNGGFCNKLDNLMELFLNNVNKLTNNSMNMDF
jgi:hypothetical protein